MVKMVELTVKNLTKKYGKTVAVKNVSFQLKEGEFFALLGPSGCGKTTTLRAIAGLAKIDVGEILFDDEPVTSTEANIHMSPADRDVAMVFQSYAIYPHMSVFDNISLPLKIKGTKKDEMKRRVRETAELLEMSELLDRKPRQLSGGQRQRVALARSIVRKPKIFLFDEPLANIDARLRIKARRDLRKLQKKLGVTAIYVTHDQKEAMYLADRVAVMKDGAIKQIGTPSEIYFEPANVFIGSFVGDPPMNMIDGSLVEKDGVIFVDFGTFRYELRNPELSEKIESSEVTSGIRPESIEIKKAKNERSIRAKVDVIEDSGGRILAHCQMGEKEIAVFTSNRNLEIGKYVWLSFPKEAIHLFDKKSGEAISYGVFNKKRRGNN